jgi:hypothetical protein
LGLLHPHLFPDAPPIDGTPRLIADFATHDGAASSADTAAHRHVHIANWADGRDCRRCCLSLPAPLG